MCARGLAGPDGLEVHGHFDVAGGRASMHTLLDRGLSVPHDVSVVGIDGHDMAEHFGLTTMVAGRLPAGHHCGVDAAGRDHGRAGPA